MELGEVYFWTDTIKDWNCLLENDILKEIIINQLKWLVDRRKIKVFAFVIMPNHMHLVWEMVDKNGKEMPHASFNKWTASQFLKQIRQYQPDEISRYSEVTTERNHRFWQRDALAVLMDSRKKVEQKIDYIHFNPLQDKWNLVEAPEHYKWSSARFYEDGTDEFGILTHYMNEF